MVINKNFYNKIIIKKKNYNNIEKKNNIKYNKKYIKI